MVKNCAKSEGKGDRRVEVKTDPLRYTSVGVAHQNVSLKGSEKQGDYEVMGPLDQPVQYETMQLGEQPIYEENF